MLAYILIKGDWIPIFSFGRIEPKDAKRQPGGRGRRGSRGEKSRREGRSGDWRKWGGESGEWWGRGRRKRKSTPLRRTSPIWFPTEGESPSEERAPSWEMSRFVLAGEGWSLSFQSMNALGFRGSSHLVNMTLFLAYEWIFPFFICFLCLLNSNRKWEISLRWGGHWRRCRQKAVPALNTIQDTKTEFEAIVQTEERCWKPLFSREHTFEDLPQI